MQEAESALQVRILVVEDEAIIAHDIKSRVERLGYEVVGIADTGAKALQLAAEAKPNLVFMDIIIQGPLDGIRTAAELGTRMDVPVIFLTALSDAATIQRVKALRPYGFLVKPFVEHDLQIAIELAIHRHRNEVQQRLLRQAEIERQESLNLVNATLDALEARVAILDDTGTVVGTNRAWRDAAVVAHVALLAVEEGQDYFAVCDQSSEGQLIARGIRQVLSGESTTFRTEYSCNSPIPNGWWSCSVSSFIAAGRQRLVVAHHDVTALKLSELERTRSEQRYQQVLDAISDLVVVADPKARVLLANKAFREVYGISSAEVSSDAALPPLLDEAALQSFAHTARVFATGEVLEAEDQVVVHQDGRKLHLHTVRSPVFNSQQQVEMVVSVARDVTERKHMEAQLRLADRMATVGTLAAGVAHEINTPVQFVADSVHFVKGAIGDLLGLIQNLQEVQLVAASVQVSQMLEEAGREIDLAYLVENLPKAIDRALDGVERIAMIVRSMREFAHPDQKEKMPADLNRGLLNTLTIARSELKYIADEETKLGDLPTVICHIGDLNQVFLNLIVNAAHAMADVYKASERRGRLTLSTWLEGEEVFIAIGDTGSGIPEEIRNRVFDPFFTTKEVGKGTGQGLAIARHIVVERHGGSLTFESRAGEGTTFLVRLPVAGRSSVSP